MKWLPTFLWGFLSGLILPVVTYLIIHFLFDRPAEKGSHFEVRYDLRSDKASSLAHYHYTLTRLIHGGSEDAERSVPNSLIS